MVGKKKQEDIELEESTFSEDDMIKELARLANEKLTAKGQDDVIMLGDSGGATNVPYWVRTDIPQLDFAVGGFTHPGFPGARIVEIFGAEASGKSTLAVWLTKMAMEQENAIAYYQDAERVLTPEIIKGTDLNINRVMLEQPDTLEQVFDGQDTVINLLAEKFPNRPAVITLDSVAACSTKAEVEGTMEDNQMATHARIMSKGFRKILAPLSKCSVLSIWVNQIREKIGISFGDNTATFGGKALPFYSSVRLKLAKVKTLKKAATNTAYGATIHVTVKKNKVAPPLREVEYDILFEQDKNGSYPRIDKEGAILDWCKGNGLIGGSSGYYEIHGAKLRKDQARARMMEDEELYNELRDLAYSLADDNEQDYTDED